MAAAVIAAAALFTGLLGEYFDDMFELSEESVVATSSDFKLVSYRTAGLFSSGDIVLRLRSREGLASREDSEDLACFIEPASGAGPEWLFDRAAFTQ